KYYALPGLRLGYLLAHSRRVAQFAAYLEPWSVNGPAQKVALACLADRSFGFKTERWLRRERNYLTQALISLKSFHPYPSSTNFLLVRIANNASAIELRSFLLNQKILIRAWNSFAGVGDDHIRIAVRRRKDNQRLLEALREWTARLRPRPTTSFSSRAAPGRERASTLSSGSEKWELDRSTWRQPKPTTKK